MKHLTLRQKQCLIVLWLGLLGGLTFYTIAPFFQPQTHGESNFLMPGRPTDFDQLVTQADVVIVGYIESIQQQGYLGGYQPDGSVIISQKNTADQPGGMPFTDYRVIVERRFKPNNALIESQPITLRLPGFEQPFDSPNPEHPLPQIGDRNVLFLSQNPDRQTYGVRSGLWGRLFVHRPYVTAAHGDQRIFETQREETINTTDFIEKLNNLPQ